MKIELNQKKMRKTNKEITDRKEIDDIINNSLVCRFAMCKNNIPYMVPLSFGYDGKNLYVHTAVEGRKIEFWETNPLICFEFDKDVKTITNEEKACKWSTAFKSVIGYGKIEEIAKKVLADNPKAVADYQKNPGSIGFLIGQLMRASGGSANPQLAKEILEKLLK